MGMKLKDNNNLCLKHLDIIDIAIYYQVYRSLGEILLKDISFKIKSLQHYVIAMQSLSRSIDMVII